MSKIRLELPVVQNWDCHNCGGCCRQHLIEVTEVERQRIIDQKWTSADGIQQSPFAWHAGPPWKKRYRLAHRSDGGCVFLDERGYCRIHAKFGEAGKPLACRIYPYAFHPKGKSYAVSLRFSCPSAVANKGRSVSVQSAELRRMAELVIPAGDRQFPPPALNHLDRVDWPDFLPFVEALDYTLTMSDVSLTTRLLRAQFWTSMVGQSTFEKLKGPRIREFLGLVMDAAMSEVTQLPVEPEPVTPVGRMYFRTLVAQFARKDTVADLSSGLVGRWKLLRAILRFARGRGTIPPLQPIFQPVPFDALEASFGPLEPEIEVLLTRYFRVKVQGLHFCGPGNFDLPFVEGAHSLILMYPVVLWLARWLAAGDSRTQLTLQDVSTALTVADHHFGYSGALGQSATRTRVKALALSGDLARLCRWYSR